MSDRDALNVRIVIAALAAIALTLVLGLIWLASRDKASELTTALVGLGGMAIGSLGTMLARTSTGGDTPPTVVLAPSTSNLEQVQTTPPIPPEDVDV